MADQLAETRFELALANRICGYEGIIDAFIEAWDAGRRHGVFEAEKFTADWRKVLYANGVRDFEPYRVDRSVPLMSDFFVPEDDVPPPGVTVQPLPSVAAAQTSR